MEAIFYEFDKTVSGARNTYDPEMPFARHQRNSQRSTLVVVISGDGELLTSAPSSVAGEMLFNAFLKCCPYGLNSPLIR